MEDAEPAMNGSSTSHGSPVRRLAWAVFAATCVLWVLAIVTTWLTRDLSSPESLGSTSADAVVGIAMAVVLLAFPIAGVVVAVRQPANPVGWILLAIGAGWGLLAGVTSYADYGLRLHPGSVPAANVAAALTVSVWAVPVGLTGTFLLLLFPDGRLPGPRWRWVAYVAALTTVLGATTGPLDPGALESTPYSHTSNPLGIGGMGPVVGVLNYAVLVLAVTMAASAVSLVVRFRRSGRVAREQVKWLAAAAGASASIYLVDLCASLLFGGSGPQPVWRVALDDAFVLSVGLTPIAIGVAVLRYRLYEIDVIIRRTLVYAALVGCLAALYLGGVYAIQTAVRSVSGQSGTLAVTTSTLLVAAAFQPLRSRIQRAVDHRFYRGRYDAARTLETFSGRLREQVDIEAVSGEVLEVVRQTLQPAHASLWLREPEAGR
ncbi:MAG TPA: hypothetical protein VHI30_03565 [Gaiellales bacterium]|jgi:hypothetical protein|nr:hypothetical protein [Gaiellales bacterium]